MYLGLLLCLCVGLVATYLGSIQSAVGSPIIGMFLGILLANVLGSGFVKKTSAGAKFSTKYLLKAGIILAGGTLSLKTVVGVGLSSLPLIIFNILLAFLVAVLVGKAFGVSLKTRILVGGGTSICGGTAIATLTPIVEADEDEMAYAMTAIFLFDIFAAIMWPYAAKAMNLSVEQYGILGGLAISDTSSVLAAGTTYDALTGNAVSMVDGEAVTASSMAVIIKLTRTVMLVFVALATMLYEAIRKNRGSDRQTLENGSFLMRLVKAFPLFVLGFIVMAVLNTMIGFSDVGIFSTTLSSVLSKIYKYLITAALVGVGCKIKLADLFTKGAKPILLGGCTWAATAISTLSYVLLLM